MHYIERHICNPRILQHLSDIDVVLHKEGKLLKRPDLMPKYNPRHLPTTIGLQTTSYGTYLYDTRMPVDALPLFKGYTLAQWLDNADITAIW